MLVHSGERPFKCKYCNMAFTTNGNMHRHMRTHANHVSKKNSHANRAAAADDSKSLKKKKVESFNVTPEVISEPVQGSSEHRSKKAKEIQELGSKIKSDHIDHEHSKANTLIRLSKKLKKTLSEPNGMSAVDAPLDSSVSRDLGLIEFSSSKFQLIANKCRAYDARKESLLDFKNPAEPICSSNKDFKISKTLENMKSKCCRSSDSVIRNGTFDDTQQQFLAKLELQSIAIGKSHDSALHCSDDDSKTTKSIYPDDFADIQSILAMTSQANVMEVADKSSVVSPTSSAKLQPTNVAPNSPRAADSAHASPVTPDQTYNSSNEKANSSESEVSNSSLHADDTNLKEHSCDNCGIDFKSIHSFRRHNRLHHQNRSVFCCQMCNYTSGDKSTLIRHLRTHNGERPFQCSLCKYSFTTKANCERHIKKRHGRFNKDEIKNSMELNKEAVKFQPDGSGHGDQNQRLDVETACQICNVDLKFNRILRHHMRSVHNHIQDKPYTCKICNLGFSTKNNCCRHVMKRHHTDKDTIHEIVIEKMSPSTDSGSDSDSSKGFTLLLTDAEAGKVEAKRPRLTDDELSSIEAIVNLANMSVAVPSEQPLDLALHALDLRVNPVKNSTDNQLDAAVKLKQQSEMYFDNTNNAIQIASNVNEPINIPRNNSSTTDTTKAPFSSTISLKNHPANECIFQTSATLDINEHVLDLSLKPEYKEPMHDTPSSPMNKEDLTDTSCLGPQDQHAVNSKRPERNGEDLASISQLLMASKQAFPMYFNEEEEMIIKVTPNPDKQRDPDSKSISSMKKRLSSYSNSPNSVLCPFCQRKFPWASSLRRHILTHTGQKPYKCSKCPLLFTTKSNCERHLFRKHDFKENCLLASDFTDSYSAETSDDGQLSCSYCQATNITKGCLSKHHCESDGKEKHYDDLTIHRFHTFPELSSACESSCTRCTEPFLNFQELEFHLKEQHDDVPCRCHLCNKYFISRASCLEHSLTEHPAQYDLDTSNKIENMCGCERIDELKADHDTEQARKMMQFCPNEDLKKHLKSHFAETQCFCHIFPRKFSLKSNLLHHIRTHSKTFSVDDLGSSDEEEEVNENEFVNFPCDSGKASLNR